MVKEEILKLMMEGRNKTYIAGYNFTIGQTSEALVKLEEGIGILQDALVAMASFSSKKPKAQREGTRLLSKEAAGAGTGKGNLPGTA